MKNGSRKARHQLSCAKTRHVSKPQGSTLWKGGFPKFQALSLLVFSLFFCQLKCCLAVKLESRQLLMLAECFRKNSSLGKNFHLGACPVHLYSGLHLLFLKFYLFTFRGEGWEKERDRNINVWLPLSCPLLGTWPATQACVLTGNRTGDPLVHRLALSPLRHTSQGHTDSLKDQRADAHGHSRASGSQSGAAFRAGGES